MWDGVYSETQAMRGRERYGAACASCHADDLLGGSAPALTGEAFMQRWNGSSVNDMMQTIRQTMPQDAPTASAYRATSLWSRFSCRATGCRWVRPTCPSRSMD